MATVRDELLALVDADAEDAAAVVDTVLAYLGDLDPSSDAELIAWHLRVSKGEFERLRAERGQLVADAAHAGAAETARTFLRLFSDDGPASAVYMAGTVLSDADARGHGEELDAGLVAKALLRVPSVAS